MQPDVGVLARDQHHAELRAEPRQEQFKPLQRLLRLQLVQIVDHQHDRLLDRMQIRQQPLDDRLAAEGGRRGDALHEPVATAPPRRARR